MEARGFSHEDRGRGSTSSKTMQVCSLAWLTVPPVSCESHSIPIQLALLLHVTPHPFQDPGVPSLQAGLALARALHKTRRAQSGANQNTSQPVPPSSRTPIPGVKNERDWAEDSNSRRGKPRSKRRFYLAFLLTKLSKDRASSVMGWTKNIASFDAAAKMFCARASARLRPRLTRSIRWEGQGHNLARSWKGWSLRVLEDL